MQPLGSSLAPASCGPSSCCCTVEGNGSVVVAPGDWRCRSVPSLPLKGTQLFCSHWQCKSLNRAPLFLDREEHTQMRKIRGGAVTGKVCHSQSNENNGLGRPEGRSSGAACRLAQPWSTSRDIQPGGSKL